ncbi:MAG TPA: hypothetical protein DHW82_07015 [Spirochaetia bacterium]|nr:MAG: hypothetical protein A2Y41_05970 [Spirochaetes bacterium GWB1_36_13]HCL56744.1 hypothetical protein [Spirochaetia bacterium]
MKNFKVYILAGGLGTRLSHIIKDVPKPMAPVSEIPFLEWQIRWLERQNFKDIVLLVGHQKEKIIKYFQDGSSFGVKINYSLEDSLLGTGGAVIKALKEYSSKNFIILNGDTFFDIDLKWMTKYYTKRKENSIYIALKYKEDTKRYGYVEIDGKYNVKQFVEKNNDLGDGYINGGIYIGNSNLLKNREIQNCSMEKDIFPSLLSMKKLKAIPFGNRFIDIGIPEDYAYANQSLKKWFYEPKTKALFLDRDGIIIEDTGYVSKIEEVKILKEIFPLIKEANQKNYKVIVITNQAGVAKGKMTISEVERINNLIKNNLEKENLWIDEFFYCPFHKDGTIALYQKESLLRKPFPGMILQACDQYNIDINQSIMIGDKDSDLIELPYLKSYLIQGRYEIKSKEFLSDFNLLMNKIE